MYHVHVRDMSLQLYYFLGYFPLCEVLCIFPNTQLTFESAEILWQY